MINKRLFGLAGMLVAFVFLSCADDIGTTNGTTYVNCKVKSRDRSGVKVLHKAGIAYIPYAAMTDVDKIKYGYDPKEEKAFFTEKQWQKEETARAIKENARKQLEKEAKQVAENNVKQEEQAKVEAAKAEVDRIEAETAQSSAEDDTVEFAVRKATGFVKEWIDNGRLIDARCLGARASLFPFGGEPNKNFFSERFLVDFEFKYLTSGGFEKNNEGSVQMGYLKQDKRWHSVQFNESTVTGVPYLETGEGRGMIERAAAMGFAQLGQMRATQTVTRAGVTSGDGTRGKVSRSGGTTDAGLSSTDKRWQNAKRIGQQIRH